MIVRHFYEINQEEKTGLHDQHHPTRNFKNSKCIIASKSATVAGYRDNRIYRGKIGDRRKKMPNNLRIRPF